MLCILAFFCSSVTSVPRHSPILSAHLLHEPGQRENKSRAIQPGISPTFFLQAAYSEFGLCLYSKTKPAERKEELPRQRKKSRPLPKQPSSNFQELFQTFETKLILRTATSAFPPVSVRFQRLSWALKNKKRETANLLGRFPPQQFKLCPAALAKTPTHPKKEKHYLRPLLPATQMEILWTSCEATC